MEGLQAKLASYDGTLEKLGKRRRMLRRQQTNAYDDAEYEELDAEVVQVSDRMRTLTQERDEVAETVERLTINAATVAPLIERVWYVIRTPSFDVVRGGVTGATQMELDRDGAATC